METMKRDPEAIARCIRDAKTIAIVSHVNPDGDTVGSAAAMRLALLSTGREVSLFCDGKIPDSLNFLPGADLFRIPEQNEGPFDLVLAVDVSDRKRMGAAEGLIARSRMTAQIDHHSTNPLYMQANSVDGGASATCVMIPEQLKALGIPLTREIAICLYAGISTDTGNFAYSSTNAEAFRVMGELMNQDLPLAEMNRKLFLVKSREQILLLGKALQSLTFHENGRTAVMKLSLADFRECGALSEHADTIINYGLYTAGTGKALLARETEEGGIKFSLRAIEPFRVDDIAKQFGGGGHPQASGFTIVGTLDGTVEQVLKAMGISD